MLTLVGGPGPADPDSCRHVVATRDGHVSFDRMVASMVATIEATGSGAEDAAEILALSGAYLAAEILECLPAVELVLAARAAIDRGVE